MLSSFSGFSFGMFFSCFYPVESWNPGQFVRATDLCGLLGWRSKVLRATTEARDAESEGCPSEDLEDLEGQ